MMVFRYVGWAFDGTHDDISEWLQYLSFLFYGFGALLTNEVSGRMGVGRGVYS